MKVDLGIWDRLNRLILFLLGAAALVGIVLWYLPTIQENERRRREILNLENLVQQQLQLSNENRTRLKALEDPKAVERLARERLHYARTGELVIRFSAPTTNPPTAPDRP